MTTSCGNQKTVRTKPNITLVNLLIRRGKLHNVITRGKGRHTDLGFLASVICRCRGKCEVLLVGHSRPDQVRGKSG